MSTNKLHGSCHCGAVRFEFESESPPEANRCNCSICTKAAWLGAIVKPAAFKLLSGEKSLGEYAFGMKSATRYFCKTCGIYCFGRGHLPEAGGDYVSINMNSLDDVELGDIKSKHWDGRHNNWEAGTRDTPWPMLTAWDGLRGGAAELCISAFPRMLKNSRRRPWLNLRACPHIAVSTSTTVAGRVRYTVAVRARR